MSWSGVGVEPPTVSSPTAAWSQAASMSPPVSTASAGTEVSCFACSYQGICLRLFGLLRVGGLFIVTNHLIRIDFPLVVFGIFTHQATSFSKVHRANRLEKCDSIFQGTMKPPIHGVGGNDQGRDDHFSDM